MSKSVLAVGAMVSAMVLASMAAGLTAVEGASQTRTVTLLDQAPDETNLSSSHGGCVGISTSGTVNR